MSASTTPAASSPMNGAWRPGSGVWMPNIEVGMSSSPMSSTTVPATTGENTRCKRGRHGASASGTTAIESDMPKASDSPPVLAARMIGVMNAKLVPVIDNSPEPNPRNDITCNKVPIPLATSDMLMR